MTRTRRARTIYRASRQLLLPAKQPIEALDRETLRKRSIEIFPSAYVTVLSIVQGIALGLGVEATLGALKAATEPLEAWVIVLEAVATITALIVVYYNYVWYLLIFRWSPGWADTVIPFGTGIGEVLLGAAIGNHGLWFVTLGALQTFAIAAFAHTLYRGSANMFRDRRDYRSTSILLIVLMSMMALGAGVAYVSARLLSVWGLWVGLVAGFIVIYGATTIVVAEHTLSAVYRNHRLQRLPHR